MVRENETGELMYSKTIEADEIQDATTAVIGECDMLCEVEALHQHQ